MEGQDDFVKRFPPDVTSADILVFVYTTSPLASFEVSRKGHEISDRTFATFVSNSPYEIIWKQRIRVSRLHYDVNGLYQIKVANLDGESATQQFLLQKAKC